MAPQPERTTTLTATNESSFATFLRSEPRRFLGLHLGTPTGFAHLTVKAGEGTMLVSGAWDFTPARFDSIALRVERFAAALREALARGVDLVVYEDKLRHRGTTVAYLHRELLNRLHSVCDDAGVQHHGLSLREIRKHATGRCDAPRKEIVNAIRLRGYKPQSDDEASAIATVLCGWEYSDEINFYGSSVHGRS